MKSEGKGAFQGIALTSLLVLAALFNQVSSTATCLSCIREDETATLLLSYSYCADQDVCLLD